MSDAVSIDAFAATSVLGSTLYLNGFRTNQGAMRAFNAPVAQPTRRSLRRVACGS
jgi:hypothetical protein